MDDNPFQHPAHRPEPGDLARELGPAHGLWTRLIAHVADGHGPVQEVWNHAKSTGWSMRLKAGARIILYLTPGRRRFTVGIVIGRHALARGLAEGSPSLQAVLKQGRTFTEGHGMRFAVTGSACLADAESLVALKMRPQQGLMPVAAAGGRRKPRDP